MKELPDKIEAGETVQGVQLCPFGEYQGANRVQVCDHAAFEQVVADWRAEGYDVSVASLSMDEQDDGSFLGAAMLRSGRQTIEFELSARGVETADGYAIKVEGLKPEENPRLAHIRELAERLPPPDEAPAEEPAEEKPAEPAK